MKTAGKNLHETSGNADDVHFISDVFRQCRPLVTFSAVLCSSINGFSKISSRPFRCVLYGQSYPHAG